ncbi:MAG: VWA domain-containing protein [Pseudomonadota bacterium]
MLQHPWIIEERVLQFVRATRQAGFTGGVSNPVAVLAACQAGPVFNHQHFRVALRCTLCGNREDWQRFDRFFDAWFERELPMLDERADDVQGVSPAEGPGDQYASHRAAERPSIGGASDASGDMQSVDFGTVFDPAQMVEIERWIDAFTQRVKRRLYRRHQPKHRGRLHYSRTLRRAHATGGEPFKLAEHGRRRRLPHVVIFVDVSQSMSAYSRFFLRFAKGLAGAFEQCQVFCFDTELTPLGDLGTSSHHLDRVSGSGFVWRGGTRIAGSLEHFMRQHARTVLKKRSTVLVLSDGFDTAAPAHLATQLGAMRRGVKRVLWLHPLLARNAGPPLDPCIVQALPHIDQVMPAHSLEALSAVADALG